MNHPQRYDTAYLTMLLDLETNQVHALLGLVKGKPPSAVEADLNRPGAIGTWTRNHPPFRAARQIFTDEPIRPWGELVNLVLIQASCTSPGRKTIERLRSAIREADQGKLETWLASRPGPPVPRQP